MAADLCPACERPENEYDRQTARWLEEHRITVSTNGDGVVSDGGTRYAPIDWRTRFYHRITLTQGGRSASLDYWSSNVAFWDGKRKPQLSDIGSHARDFLTFAIEYESPTALMEAYPGMKRPVASSFIRTGKSLRETLDQGAVDDLMNMEF